LRSIALEAAPALMPKYYSNIMPPMDAEYWTEDDDDFWITNAGIPWEEP
jgi:hypothetical protein